MAVALYDQRSQPLVHVIYWVFGIRSYSDLPDMSFEFPIGRFLFSLSTLFAHFILGYICGRYLGNLNSRINKNYNPELLFVTFYGNISITAVCTILSWFHYKGIQNYMLDSTIVYRMLQSVGIPNYHDDSVVRTLFSRLTFAVICVIGMVGINTFLCLNEGHPFVFQIILPIFLNHGIILIFFVESSFFVMIRFTSGKILKLNNLLESMITSDVQMPQHKKVVSGQPKTKNKDISHNYICRTLETDRMTMRIVKQSHQRLVSICHNVGRTYGLQILTSVATAFVIITVGLFSVYALLTTPIADSENFKQTLFSLVYWLCYFGLRIFVFCSACQESSEEALRTGDIICELYDESSLNEHVRAEIRDFNLQLIQNPLRYTASGFFSIDYSLIQGVVSSISTYLVILIQLRNLPLDEEKNDQAFEYL